MNRREAVGLIMGLVVCGAAPAIVAAEDTEQPIEKERVLTSSVKKQAAPVSLPVPSPEEKKPVEKQAMPATSVAAAPAEKQPVETSATIRGKIVVMTPARNVTYIRVQDAATRVTMVSIAPQVTSVMQGGVKVSASVLSEGADVSVKYPRVFKENEVPIAESVEIMPAAPGTVAAVPPIGKSH